MIAAKHSAYADKPVEARMPDMLMEKIDEAIGQLISPYARVTPRERRNMAALLHKEVEKDNDPVQRLGLKIEAHRKLMRYEQRAVNRLRGAARGQK